MAWGPPKKNISQILRTGIERIRAYGDAVFVVSLLLGIGCSALIFYHFVYLPVSVQPEAPPRPAIFNTGLYKKVLEGVDLRSRASSEALEHIPRNPF